MYVFGVAGQQSGRRGWTVEKSPSRVRRSTARRWPTPVSRSICLLFALVTAIVVAAPVTAADAPINPFPRVVIDDAMVATWEFARADAIDGWRTEKDCTIGVGDDRLMIEASGRDPIVRLPRLDASGPFEISLRLRSDAPNNAEFFWTTDKQGWSPQQRVHLTIPRDGKWHEPSITIDVHERISELRFDPSSGPGRTDVAWLRVRRHLLHPLEIESVSSERHAVVARVRNHGAAPRDVRSGTIGRTIPPGGVSELKQLAAGMKTFEPIDLLVESPGLPALRRRANRFDPGVPIPRPAVRLRKDALSITCATDGSGAAIRLRDDTDPGPVGQDVVAILAPLVTSPDGVGLRPLQLVESDGQKTIFRGGPVRSLELQVDGDELHYRLDATESCEGPVVRVFGGLEQGLLAGVEYLGHAERSSSTLDIRTPEHLRFAPDPMDLTMPLMALVTNEASVAMTWSDMTLGPVFATPNFFDGTDDHRMALRGKQIDATLRVTRGWANGQRLEDAILWAVGKHGLPPVPTPPRSWDAQKSLCMAALNGPLKSADGWGHCAQPNWARNPFADHASTIFRLTGKLPELPKLTPGGAHIRNSAAYFLSGRAGEWLALRHREADRTIREQRPDGSFRYSGRFADGHFEETASGRCGLGAVKLMRHTWYTGDADSLAAGLRAVAFARRFRTPRGAQTWEVPLHTPDIMASGHLTEANVLAFRLTGDDAYLAEARRWAISGLPFIYQWSNQPIMLYATTPVFGATHWTAVNWIGLPVQWCGLTYAEAILMLAEHDDTLDWRRLADGITTSGEQQQYPDGASVGCLPDSFALASQQRRPADINPCALVSLRMRLRGELDGVAVVKNNDWRIIAPCPARINGNQLLVDGHDGVAYQIIVFDRKAGRADAKATKPRIIDVRSRGRDVIDLASP